MARLEKLISLVNEYKKIEVSKLAKLLGVSNVTIRKDLDILEERGIINRQHGFALINSTDNINFRLAQNHEVKQKIAQKAAETVSDGEIVMIESGSTCALLAEELATHRKDVTIITNSVFITSYIPKSSNAKVILIGGEYQRNSQANVGPLVKKVVEEFYVDKLFIGIDGFDMTRGYCSNDIARCDTAQTMASSSRHVIALTDSTKFTQKGTLPEFSTEQISAVFTDKQLDQTVKNLLLKQGVELHLV